MLVGPSWLVSHLLMDLVTLWLLGQHGLPVLLLKVDQALSGIEVHHCGIQQLCLDLSFLPFQHHRHCYGISGWSYQVKSEIVRIKPMVCGCHLESIAFPNGTKHLLLLCTRQCWVKKYSQSVQDHECIYLTFFSLSSIQSCITLLGGGTVINLKSYM